MLYMILALLLFTAFTLVGTVAARNGNTNVISLTSQVASLIIPLVASLPALAKQNVQSQKFGIWMAVLTGLLVGAYAIVLNKGLTQNKVAIIIPVVLGGGIVLTTILSYFIFKEKITPVESIGLGLVLVGLAVIIYARVSLV